MYLLTSAGWCCQNAIVSIANALWQSSLPPSLPLSSLVFVGHKRIPNFYFRLSNSCYLSLPDNDVSQHLVRERTWIFRFFLFDLVLALPFMDTKLTYNFTFEDKKKLRKEREEGRKKHQYWLESNLRTRQSWASYMCKMSTGCILLTTCAPAWEELESEKWPRNVFLVEKGGRGRIKLSKILRMETLEPQLKLNHWVIFSSLEFCYSFLPKATKNGFPPIFSHFS